MNQETKDFYKKYNIKEVFSEVSYRALGMLHVKTKESERVFFEYG